MEFQVETFNLSESKKKTFVVQVKNYKIVVDIFHTCHKLTWYSAIAHKFTRIYPVCSTYELTKICVKNCTIDLKKNNLYFVHWPLVHYTALHWLSEVIRRFYTKLLENLLDFSQVGNAVFGPTEHFKIK